MLKDPPPTARVARMRMQRFKARPDIGSDRRKAEIVGQQAGLWKPVATEVLQDLDGQAPSQSFPAVLGQHADHVNVADFRLIRWVAPGAGRPHGPARVQGEEEPPRVKLGLFGQGRPASGRCPARADAVVHDGSPGRLVAGEEGSDFIAPGKTDPWEAEKIGPAHLQLRPSMHIHLRQRTQAGHRRVERDPLRQDPRDRRPVPLG